MVQRRQLWRAGELINIVIYALLIAEMLRIWLVPTMSDYPRIQTLAIMMGFEFILVHSGIFMLVFPRKVSLMFLVPVYGIAALAMNTGAENNTILYLYIGVLITRFRFLYSDIKPDERFLALILAFITAVIYMLCMVVIIAGEHILPDMGLNSDFLSKGGYYDSLEVGGLFTEEPHLPIIMGILYFSAMIVFEIKTFRKFQPKKD